mmetsp:Transcript_21431/g.49886  ORF Transcript_21431/g.49886 Transcript_21431/m.49886 type:complete len:203 (-) Transcript_21431:60-668(-)
MEIGSDVCIRAPRMPVQLLLTVCVGLMSLGMAGTGQSGCTRMTKAEKATVTKCCCRWMRMKLRQRWTGNPSVLQTLEQLTCSAKLQALRRRIVHTLSAPGTIGERSPWSKTTTRATSSTWLSASRVSRAFSSSYLESGSAVSDRRLRTVAPVIPLLPTYWRVQIQKAMARIGDWGPIRWIWRHLETDIESNCSTTLQVSQKS